jgi:hypothetical protein
MQTVDEERESRRFRGGSHESPLDAHATSHISSSSARGDLKAELKHVYDFLLDFADRLEELHGQDTAVESFSLSPRMKARTASFSDFDPDKAIARCEACLTALHRLHRGSSSPTIGKSVALVASDSEATLRRLRQDLLEAREGTARAEQQAQTSFHELEYNLVALIGTVCSLLDVAKPSFESMDPAKNCQMAVSALDGFMSQVKDLMVIDISPLTSSESSPSVASNAMVPADAWEDNTESCAVCAKKLGKRNLHRRHHCRACGKCVCSACSPSMVKFSEGDPQRVCTPCVSGAFLNVK